MNNKKGYGTRLSHSPFHLTRDAVWRLAVVLCFVLVVHNQPDRNHLQRQAAKRQPQWHILASRGGACDTTARDTTARKLHVFLNPFKIFFDHISNRFLDKSSFSYSTIPGLYKGNVVYSMCPH